MRDKIAVVLRALFEAVKYSVEAFSLPTGKHLLPSLLFGTIILFISILCSIMQLPCFISWQGALLGDLVLLTILLIERSERHEVSTFYRAAANSVQSVVQRAKELGKGRTTEDSTSADNSGSTGCEDNDGGESEVSD